MRLFFISLFFISSACLYAQQRNNIDTLNIFSLAMNKDVKVVLIKPDGYKKTKSGLPVVYLLHGYGGAYNSWAIKMPGIQKLATEFNAFIVCPDGGFSSWYVNSPIDSSIQYETFISRELVNYIDAHYKTNATIQGRAITGLSMGGHGALMLGIRHQDVFGAAGSMSGAVVLTKEVARFGAEKLIGDSVSQLSLWNSYSVYSLVDTLSNKKFPMIIDCGTGDIFIRQNRRLHEKLMQLKIRHSYMERTGIHSWNYWTTGLPYQMIFFRAVWEQK